MLNHKGTIEIETERLLLRRFKREDAKDMYLNWANDSEVTRFLQWVPHRSIEDTQEILETWVTSYSSMEVYSWAMVLKDKEKVIGSIGVVNRFDQHRICELGYCSGREYWNKGFMSEALRGVIEYLFTEVGYNRLEAIHHSENIASGRVMLHAGMLHEGKLRDYRMNNAGDLVDCDMYSVLLREVKGTNRKE